MFCSRCGTQVNEAKFCPNCGNQIVKLNVEQPTQSYQLGQQQNGTYYQQTNNYQNIPNTPVYKTPKRFNQIIIGVCVACAVIVISVAYILITGQDSSVYFSDDNNVNSDNNISENNSGSNNSTSNKLGVTSVEHDNTYTINVATTEQNIIDVIKQDSLQEKEGCPEQIIAIENRIINNYEIDAVNLCELDLDFALELEQVIKYIYDEYPTARGYLSHISLGNMEKGSTTIAFFQWIFPFTESTIDGNLGYKSRIILNSSYYLNLNKFKSDVKRNSNAGHFPKNATVYSPLAHEFAHYLSFVATNHYHGVEPQMILTNNYVYEKYYLAILDFNDGTHSKRMIEEAYNNYKMKTGTTLSFDEFRATISQYAMAKDSSGQYIWDETIAEAFHDVYLNGDNAADASKEIVAVLRKYVEM